MPSDRSRDATLRTERTELVPLAVGDAEEMAGVLGAPELYGFIGGGPPTVAELTARYARLAAGHSADRTEEWHNWVVRLRTDGRAVGTVQATVLDGGRRAEVAWVIGLPWQGRGYAAEAALALADWLRGRGMREIAAYVHPEHVASAAVAAHAGLAATGHLDEDGEQRWEWTAPDPLPD